MTHLRASCPLQFPLFSYSLDYDRRMTYVIFKGSKTRNRTRSPVPEPGADLNRFTKQASEATKFFQKKKFFTSREIFSPPRGLSSSPDTHRPSNSRASRLL